MAPAWRPALCIWGLILVRGALRVQRWPRWASQEKSEQSDVMNSAFAVGHHILPNEVWPVVQLTQTITQREYS